MTHHDFKSTLRSLAAGQLPTPPTPHDIARQLLRRDHRLTRLLTLLTLLFWTLGTAGLLWLVFALNRFVIFLRISPGLPWSFPPHPGQIPDRWTPADYMFWGTDLIHHSTPYIAAAIACLVLAAISTVLLISTSRQSTLNRINLSLAEIAEQLKHAGLTPAQSSPQPPPGPNPPDERNPMRPLLIITLLLAAAALTGAIVHAAHPTTRPWTGYPKLSPFHAVRYPTPTTIEVQISDTWYDLKSFNDLPTPDLIKGAQSLDPKDWQKRLEEDLVELLTRTHHTPPSLDTATLELTNLTTHETTTQQVPMTKENRWALWDARNPKPTTAPTPK